MIDLKNLNVVVTGATGIIGNSILDKLVLGGSNILATGTNEEKLKNIKNKYEKINILKFQNTTKSRNLLITVAQSSQIKLTS